MEGSSPVNVGSRMSTAEERTYNRGSGVWDLLGAKEHGDRGRQLRLIFDSLIRDRIALR